MGLFFSAKKESLLWSDPSCLSEPSCISEGLFCHIWSWRRWWPFLSLCQVYALLLLSQGRRGLALLSFPWQMLSPVPLSSQNSYRSVEHKQQADMGSVEAFMNLLLLCAMPLISGKMILGKISTRSAVYNLQFYTLYFRAIRRDENVLYW